jgi:hypothetical protein
MCGGFWGYDDLRAAYEWYLFIVKPAVFTFRQSRLRSVLVDAIDCLDVCLIQWNRLFRILEAKSFVIPCYRLGR